MSRPRMKTHYCSSYGATSILAGFAGLKTLYCYVLILHVYWRALWGGNTGDSINVEWTVAYGWTVRSHRSRRGQRYSKLFTTIRDTRYIGWHWRMRWREVWGTSGFAGRSKRHGMGPVSISKKYVGRPMCISRGICGWIQAARWLEILGLLWYWFLILILIL